MYDERDLTYDPCGDREEWSTESESSDIDLVLGPDPKFLKRRRGQFSR